MQNTQRNIRLGLRSAAVAAVLLSGLSSSCVTQKQYKDARDLAKSYQMQLYDQDQVVARLETENDRLLMEMSRAPGTIEAGYSDDVHERMGALQTMIDELDGPLKDIEQFSVDGGQLYMIQDKVLFTSGSDELGAEGRKALQGLARGIQANSHGNIYVRGHTDADPVSRPETVKRFPHGNLQLSAARAVSVAAALVEAGVTDSEVVVVGFGKHKPVAANDSSDNKRLNRRVEVFVSDK
ncbi:MAG: chemotaxis protein MotB [Chlamydiales bacterium]|jgi:chemotaxis protein MotB